MKDPTKVQNERYDEIEISLVPNGDLVWCPMGTWFGAQWGLGVVPNGDLVWCPMGSYIINTLQAHKKENDTTLKCKRKKCNIEK